MIYSKIPLAQTLVQLCKLYGFQNIVISPGSRNAPLTIGFSEDAYFTCYSIVDERCAAFFAMGIAQQTERPAVLVCTSGSAVLNYYPAIAEAFFSNIPLVVLSADRPEYLLNIGDGQTIVQKNVFENHIAYSANLKLDISPEKGSKNPDNLEIINSLENNLERFIDIQKGIQKDNESEINKAFNIALNQSRPVHINAPFNEPLYETTEILEKTISANKLPRPNNSLSEETLQACVKDWNSAKRKTVLVGVLKPNEIEKQLIEELANDESVLIFSESTSNIHGENLFPSIDKIIAPLLPDDFADLQPEILLTIGGMIVSKKIKAFLRKYSPQQHWHVGIYGAMDTFFKLNRYINVEPNIFLQKLLPLITKDTSYYRLKWDLIKEKRRSRHEEYLEKIDFSDLKVFDSILRKIPKDIILHLSNSATIRYAQLFTLPESIEVFCNRGTSGIDGSTSTAVGCATIREKPTLLITGDLSFFYDSNALWNEYIPRSFRIIVINNQGGGIFRILPGHQDIPTFDNFFETVHNLKCKKLCEMFGFDYLESKDEEELKLKLIDFFKNGERPKLLEIFTPRTKNDVILHGYFDYIGER